MRHHERACWSQTCQKISAVHRRHRHYYISVIHMVVLNIHASSRAVQDLVCCSSGSTFLQVNFCGKLSTDSAPQVRAAFIDMIGTWLQKLDERLDHLGRLLPYLLTALSDSSTLVQKQALEQIDAIGALHEQDNAKDIKDVMTYLPSEAHSIGWMSTANVWALHAERKLPVPDVFVQRPRVGARRVVAANFGHISHALAMELVTWQEEHRARAAHLLATYLVYIEDWAQQYFHELVPALCRALVAEPDASKALDVQGAAARCCKLMGLFAPCSAFLDIALPRVRDEAAELPLQLGAVRAGTAAIQGARAAQLLDAEVGSVLNVLASTALLDNQEYGSKTAVAEAVEACVGAASAEWLQGNQVQVMAAALRVSNWEDAGSEAQAALHQRMCVCLQSALGRLQAHATKGCAEEQSLQLAVPLFEHSECVGEAALENAGVAKNAEARIDVVQQSHPDVAAWLAQHRYELEVLWGAASMSADDLWSALQRFGCHH